MIRAFFNAFVFATISSIGSSSALLDVVMDLYAYLPVESYRFCSGWAIIIDTYADHFYFFNWSILLCIATEKICPVDDASILLLYLLLAVFRGY